MPRRSAFTLVELMVACAVNAVLIGIALPDRRAARGLPTEGPGGGGIMIRVGK